MIPCIAAYVQFIGRSPESGALACRMVELYLDAHYCLDELSDLVHNLPHVTRVALYDVDQVTPFATHDVIPFGSAQDFLETLSGSSASD